MSFEDFKEHVEILSEEDSQTIRELHIEHFVNTEKDSFNKHIRNKELFSDGYCYTGYLWDNLFSYNRITMEYLLSELINKKEVIVLWDIHSCERILIKDYWKFPKNRLLKLDAKVLIQGIEYLPEDIYIFDIGVSWSYITTHEDDGKRRICFKVS